MGFPAQNDYIDIHTHGAEPHPGRFSVETLMAHEGRSYKETSGLAFIAGIHPWYLTPEDHDAQLSYVKSAVLSASVIGVGEAGFDKLRGPGTDLQRKTFEEQVDFSIQCNKPVIVHCVRSWEELLESHRRLRPVLPWLVHGFRAKKELALSLISKGFYLSFWFDFILRSEASGLIAALPVDRIFLETDGSGTEISLIYSKVASDLKMTADELKTRLYNNFCNFFNKKV